MQKIAVSTLPIALSLIVLSAPAQSAYVQTAVDFVRYSDNLCVRTSSWSNASSMPGCEGEAMAKMPPDADGDGIADSADKCPGTAKGTATNSEGCVLEASLDLETIEFETGTAVLSTESRAALDDIAATLAANSHMKFEVAGHTDNTGDDEINTKLSRERALSVRNYLVEQGVPEANLTAHGYGPRHPIASNETSEGRAQNRRVELVLK